MITPEQFYAWKQDLVTVAVRAKFKWMKDQSKEKIFNTIRDSDSILMQREYIGAMDIIDLLLELEVDDLHTVVDESEEIK